MPMPHYVSLEQGMGESGSMPIFILKATQGV